MCTRKMRFSWPKLCAILWMWISYEEVIVKEMEAESNAPLFSPDKFAATPVTKFYSGKSLFVTGGTGFVGMILLGKILATCPIKRVYVLMKPKKGKNIQNRIADLIQSPVFEEVRMHNKTALSNIIPISGDICEEKLGISEESIAILNKEVQVVFHVAADVNLSSDLPNVIKVNTMGTQKLVKLSKGMRQLKVFVYVSTAYSNSNKNLIDEQVYTPNTSLEAVYDIYQELVKGNNKINFHHLMEGRPNAYTYSKSLAEKIIQDGILGIPAVVVRPSIIVSSISSPKPGWTSSWNGVNMMATEVSQGYLRCWHGLSHSLFDIVPVDQVANLLIASAWDADRRQLKHVKVFNCCTGLQNPLSVEGFLGSCLRLSNKYSERAIINTNMPIITKSRVLYEIVWFLLQSIPAFFLDFYATLASKVPRMMKKNRSILRALEVLEYFGFNDYTFIDYNVRQLLRDMDPRDRAVFDFDFSAVNWQSYLKDYVMGLDKYLVRK